MNRWTHALTRRLRSLCLRTAALGNARERPVGHGLRMTIDPGDFMDRTFYLRTYDPTLITLLDAWLRPGDAALDCGAQKGYVALHLGRAVGRSGRVLAFEPDARARAALEQHIARNGLPQIEPIACALGEAAGTLRFHLSSQLGWSTAFPNALAAPKVTETVEVPMATLDELRRSGHIAWPAGQLRWIKIDCEGSEVRVLRGMQATLHAEDPLLWIEINADALCAAETSAGELFDLLRGLGYALYRPQLCFTPAGSARVRLHPCGQPLDQALYDLVAVKPATWSARAAGLHPTVTAGAA